jgi:hypothetical protein
VNPQAKHLLESIDGEGIRKGLLKQLKALRRRVTEYDNFEGGETSCFLDRWRVVQLGNGATTYESQAKGIMTRGWHSNGKDRWKEVE